MIKTIEFNTKKEIEYKEILTVNDGSICAYKNTVYINGKEEYLNEGICYLKDLLELKDNKGLPGIDLTVYKKDVENVFINNSPNNIHFYEKIKPLKIDNPYTYIENNTDWGLYSISFSSNSIYDYNKEELPKGIYFDYINGHISNDVFDLEDMLEKLQKRKDIKFAKDEDKILEIPYYNRERDRNRYLKFIWTPNKEDYDTIKNLNHHSRYENIIKRILCIAEKEDGKEDVNEG
jgi:hypothetical protein